MNTNSDDVMPRRGYWRQPRTIIINVVIVAIGGLVSWAFLNIAQPQNHTLVGVDIVPAIPSEYKAFFEQDPVVGPALQNADGRYTKMVRPPTGGDYVSPVGYALGSDVDFSVDFCVLNPRGFLFNIANYDENKDGDPDTVYAVYMPSANGTVDGECQPRIVVSVEPAVFK